MIGWRVAGTGKQEIYIKCSWGNILESLCEGRICDWGRQDMDTEFGYEKCQKLFRWKTGRLENNINMELGKAGSESGRLM
jgi:hypothetical protein